MKVKRIGSLVGLLLGGLLLMNITSSFFDSSGDSESPKKTGDSPLSNLDRLRLEIAEKEVAWQRTRIQQLEAKLGGTPGTRAGASAALAPIPAMAARASLRGAKQQNEANLGQQQDRANAVKAAMQHAWKGYEKCAMGMDEISPRTCRGNSRWQGLAVTLVDSLDTLYVMGLHEEFDRAVEYVQTKLQFPRKGQVSVFETTIRVVGGLLGAHALSTRPGLLEKAKEMADMLTPAFEVSASGLPYPLIDLGSQKASTQPWTTGVVLADFGSMALEFRYLSQQLGDPKYAQLVDKVYERCAELQAKEQTQDGLFPVYVDPEEVER
jgi:hypothetical protein